MTIQKPSSNARLIALLIGITFLGLGIAGFIPALVTLPANAVSSSAPLGAEDIPLTAGTDYLDGFVLGFGYLFGLFPTNTLHNILHVALGAFGLYSATGSHGTYNYNRFCAGFLPLIALLGLLPATNALFGAIPIYGNNIWVSAIAGALAVFATVTSEKPEGELV